jgi:putative membrane protein
MTWIRILAGVGLVGVMAHPGLAEELAQQDLEFATKAAEGGLMEVQLGELAQEQAKDEQVVEFGHRMVQDHGQANEKLKTIAEQKGISLPQELPPDAQQKYEELKQLSDAEFDKAYMDEMVSDHEKDIAAFEQEAQSGQDPDLRAFAEETLPTLREHLEVAEETQSQLTAAAEGTSQEAGSQMEQQLPPEDVIGSKVVTANGDDVGEIEDLVVDQNQERYAIVSVGGFLGIGDKNVAVPLDQLEPGEDHSYVLSALTEEQLEQMPAYEEGQYQSLAQQQQ